MPMIPVSRLAPFAAVAAVVVTLDACKRPQVETPGPRTTSAVDTSFRQGATRDSIAERIRQQAIEDSIRNARAMNAREADALRNTLRDVIHFDFDESAHAANRRAEFEITAGGDRLVRPRT